MMASTASSVRQSWLAELMQCPRCTGRLETYPVQIEDGAAIGFPPVRRGIPTFVDDATDAVSRRTQSSFGYEWTHFSDWQPSGAANFADYFAEFDLASLAGATVLDAGCGMGRHARFVAPHAERVVAVDFSAAIDSAARNLESFLNVACVRADLRALPFSDRSFDFVYSLGVLHHLADPEAAIRTLAAKLRPGGRLRIYVYWAQTGWKRRLLSAVSAVRRVTTRMPLGVLRGLCWLLSVGLFALVIFPYRILLRLGLDVPPGSPLFVYTKYPFRVLYNDQFDRFSAPIEKRYTAAQARRLLESAGLIDLRLIERFGWIVEGRKP